LAILCIVLRDDDLGSPGASGALFTASSLKKQPSIHRQLLYEPGYQTWQTSSRAWLEARHIGALADQSGDITMHNFILEDIPKKG